MARINMKRKNIVFVLQMSFYIYAFSYWIQYALIGKQLMFLEKPAEAVSILQTSKLFMVDFMKIMISHKKAWYLIIPELIKIISIPYCIVVYLWVYIDDHDVFKYLSYIIAFTIVAFGGVVLTLSQQSLGNGIRMANTLGAVIIVVSILMEIVLLFNFLKKRKLMVEFND